MSCFDRRFPVSLPSSLSFKLLFHRRRYTTQSRERGSWMTKTKKSPIGWKLEGGEAGIQPFTVNPMFSTRNQILHRSRSSRPRTISIKRIPRIHSLYRMQMLMNRIAVNSLVLKWLYYNIRPIR